MQTATLSWRLLSQGIIMIDLGYLDRRLADAHVLVYDSETDGLDWKKNHIVGHVLTFSGDPADSHYLPIRHAGGANLDPDRVNAMLRPHLARQTLRVIGHNIKFDLGMLANDNLHVGGPLEDTMVDA